MPQSFGEIREQVESSLESSSQPNSNQESNAPESSDDVEAKNVAQAIAELDKMERFKFRGKEYTPKELEAIFSRDKETQKAFTQKTQALAEERKVVLERKKYFDNLAYDLDAVRKNPSLAQEFLKIYPKEFHSYLDQITRSTSEGQNVHQPVQSQIPVEYLSKVEQLERFVRDQEVAKAEGEINQYIESVKKEFPRASMKEVLADVYEYWNQLEPDPITGMKPPLTIETFREAAKASEQERINEYTAWYKDKQEQQRLANEKGKGVAPGGGTVGQAPKKYKSFSELNKDVISNFTKQAAP